MNRFALVFSIFFVSSAHASVTLVKDCVGTSDQGPVEVTISKSTVETTPTSPFQGYFQADVMVNGTTVFSTEYIVYNSADEEYFTEGNSDLVLAATPGQSSLYLHVWNADGSITVPSFDTVALTCR